MPKTKWLIWGLLPPILGFGQSYKEAPETLQLDTNYSYFQFFTKEAATNFYNAFHKEPTERTSIFHFGASHVQAEVMVTEARAALQNEFGDAGRGLVFNYGAANTYTSINYNSTKQGTWTFAKSFMTKPSLPLGVMGMTVQSEELGASLIWDFKKPISIAKHRIRIFANNDEKTPDFEVIINEQTFSFDRENRILFDGLPFFEIVHEGAVSSLRINLVSSGVSGTQFTFYGVDFQNQGGDGLVYHSLGVGAAPMEAMLRLDAMPEQAKVLNPDVVFLDFGTNNILYTNTLDSNIKTAVSKAIALFRSINPEVVIVLTTTQDLYHKGRVITAGVAFRDLMKDLARTHNCVFWNWYDQSGGLNSIRQWGNDGYAQKDHIHLTWKGYRLKGQLIHKSVMNTLEYIEQNQNADSLVLTSKAYEFIEPTPSEIQKSKPSSKKYHTVKSGESLWSISKKYGSSVEKIQKMNGLRSTLITPGQKLRIR